LRSHFRLSLRALTAHVRVFCAALGREEAVSLAGVAEEGVGAKVDALMRKA
jgi:hypothetical protein